MGAVVATLPVTGSLPSLPTPPTAPTGGWTLAGAKRLVTGAAGTIELHDGAADQAPSGAATVPLRRGELQPESQTGAPTAIPRRASTAADGPLTELRSPVYLNAQPSGGQLEVLLTGGAACAADAGLVLWKLASGSWAGAVRLTIGASTTATCSGRQVVLTAPVPEAWNTAPPANIVTPGASALS